MSTATSDQGNPLSVEATLDAMTDDLRMAIVAVPFDEFGGDYFKGLPLGWRLFLEAYEIVDDDGHLSSYGIEVHNALPDASVRR